MCMKEYKKELKPTVNLDIGSKAKLNFGSFTPFWSNEKSFGYEVSEGGITKVLFAPKRLNEQLVMHFERGKRELEIEVGEYSFPNSANGAYRTYTVK